VHLVLAHLSCPALSTRVRDALAGFWAEGVAIEVWKVTEIIASIDQEIARPKQVRVPLSNQFLG
jgi:hypothetical protein